MLPAIIECSSFQLRPWTLADKTSLIEHANNRNIWRNLWDAFPHPYTDADADRWLNSCVREPGTDNIYAIDIDGSAVGTVALERRTDIERMSAEIGYWIGERFWGRGIMTEAVTRVSELALAEPDLIRLFAPVFAWNAPSMRVLEKCGFVREATLKRAGFKDGTVIDRVIFAKVRASTHPYVAAD